MYNPYSLEGKTILVTGASSGIGRTTAIECSKMGAKMIITARNEERLKETLSALEGDNHQMILADLGNEEDLNKLVSELPKLDGIVNNAGFTKTLPLQFIKREQFVELLNVNTVAPILLLHKILKKKLLNNESSIVFTSSIAGLGLTAPGNAMYTSSKGAISAYIKNAALELSAKKIRVNAVCPGMVNTGILELGTVTEAQLQEDEKKYPLGRYGEPRDIALAIIYLLSNASAWVTGTNMIIDGGISLK